MEILVTGGAGYIGSHVVDVLVDRGFRVVVIDNLSTGHLQAVHDDAIFYQVDLLDKQAVDSVFKKHSFDAIMHFASHTLVGESMIRPWLYLCDNVHMVINMLKAGVPAGLKRFIFSSTANLFENPEKMPISEAETIKPGSPYGESKFTIERILGWIEILYGLKYCSLRYFNAAGAHPDGHIGEDHDPETHLIPRVLEVALGKKESITIYGTDYDTEDGTCVRDYVHVMDLVDAHLLALEAIEDGESHCYNLGNQEGHSVREVIEIARKVTGREIPVIEGPRRPGDPACLIADSSLIQSELGWASKYSSLQDIIRTAWDWHRVHPDGYVAE
jgi:UDP-glucose 4-epimerase